MSLLRITLCGAAVACVFGCGLPAISPETDWPWGIGAGGPSEGLLFYGAYEGTLECADCQGDFTRLALYVADPDDGAGTYVLEEGCAGAIDGAPPLEFRGAWSLVRGVAGDRDARLVQLDLGAGQFRAYRIVNASEIRRTSQDGREIEAEPGYSLYRVESND